MLKFKSCLILSIIAFVLVYNPPIFSFNAVHLIAVGSWIYLLTHAGYVSKKFGILKLFWAEMILICMALYVASVAILNDNSVGSAIPYLMVAFDVIPTALAISLYALHSGLSTDDILLIIIYMGLYQAFCAVIALMIPEVHQFFIDKLIHYGYAEQTLQTWGFRMYGFATNLTHTTPIVQAFIAVICMQRAIDSKLRNCGLYIFASVLLCISAFVNARTSLIIVISGVLYIFVFNLRRYNLKRFLKVFVGVLAAWILLTIVIGNFQQKDLQLYDWFMDAYNDILSIFDSSVKVNYSGIKALNDSRFYKLPYEWNRFIFGTGTTIMASSQYNVNSDIGFINDIWLGGIILFGTYTFVYLKLIRTLYNCMKNNLICKFVLGFAIITMIFANWKGIANSCNNLTSLLAILSISSLVLVERKCVHVSSSKD